LKDFANMRDATNTLARRVKNMRIRFAKKHVQISINKLRDRKKIVSQFIHKSDIIQGEEVIYLDDAGTKHLTFLIIPKSHILLV
jgi:D-Tyr-tRNAtyr deacylase